MIAGFINHSQGVTHIIINLFNKIFNSERWPLRPIHTRNFVPRSMLQGPYLHD